MNAKALPCLASIAVIALTSGAAHGKLILEVSSETGAARMYNPDIKPVLLSSYELSISQGYFVPNGLFGLTDQGIDPVFNGIEGWQIQDASDSYLRETIVEYDPDTDKFVPSKTLVTTIPPYASISLGNPIEPDPPGALADSLESADDPPSAALSTIRFTYQGEFGAPVTQGLVSVDGVILPEPSSIAACLSTVLLLVGSLRCRSH